MFSHHLVQMMVDTWTVVQIWLTHWDRVMHICVSKLTIIGSDNGLSPGRRQAIIWSNAGILLIGPFGTNFRDILIEIHIYFFREDALEIVVRKLVTILSRPQCVKHPIASHRFFGLVKTSTCLCKTWSPLEFNREWRLWPGSPHKNKCGALKFISFSLINCWTNNQVAGDFWRDDDHVRSV